MTEVKHGMRFRSIKSTIRKKLDSWLKSIGNPQLVTAIKRDVIVSGGCIATMAAGEGVNDYDVYFRTKNTAANVAQYYISKFARNDADARNLVPRLCSAQVKNIKGETEERLLMHIQSAGAIGTAQPEYKFFESQPDWDLANYFETDSHESSGETPEEVYAALSAKKTGEFTAVFFTNNAITLTGDIQLVIRFFGEPSQIHTNYDFAHCMGYYEYANDSLHVPADTMQCLLERTLVYKGSLYPLCTMLRLRKFLTRGWRIDAGEMLKIAYNVGEVDFEDPEMLREQLMGVDVAYMHQFIGALTQARKNGTRITPTYFAELLDKCYD